MHVETVSADRTHDLRRKVLRDGRADAPVTFPEDDDPRAFHLAAVDDGGAVVGVASFLPSDWEGRFAFQLRGMAVDPELQHGGVGTALMTAAAGAARERGAEVIWANGRDTALGFYERLGWKVVGDGFVYGPMALPHHVVVYELERSS